MYNVINNMLYQSIFLCRINNSIEYRNSDLLLIVDIVNNRI